MSAPLNGTVMGLTFRQLFVRRRLIAAAVLCLVPAAVAGVYSAGTRQPGMPPDAFLGSMYTRFVIGVLLPLGAVVFGTGAFGLDLDEGTLVYLLVKPLRRWQVVLSRYVVAVAATAATMVPAILLPWLIMGRSVTPLGAVLGVAAGTGVGCLLYCAVFIPLGIVSKRALVLGLLYVVVLEEVLSNQITGVKSLSIREYAVSTVQATHPTAASAIATVSMTTVWVMGAIILVGGLGIAIRKLAGFEAAERL